MRVYIKTDSISCHYNYNKLYVLHRLLVNWKHPILSVSLLPWQSPDGTQSPYIAVGIYCVITSMIPAFNVFGVEVYACEIYCVLMHDQCNNSCSQVDSRIKCFSTA